MERANYFVDILLRHEIFLPEKANFEYSHRSVTEESENSEENVITCASDPNRAMRKLEATLRLELHRLNEFMKGLEAFLSDDGYLAAALLPLQIINENAPGAAYQQG